nr:SKI/DACH domain-containing protein 1-like [Paramormyrops kingsleyae]
MGDLESGFEEMEGVKLGYLVIEGKQMFALSQVFTDLLKNIPRTTVHKRMDHLKVKKHHCDLEELRKLKAINSIAFHAAKCTLISREDVEALYVSCKADRLPKSKKRKSNSRPPDLYDGQIRSEPRYNFWKKHVWFRLHDASQPFSFKHTAGRQEVASSPACNLPQIYSKFISHSCEAVNRTACRASKNYETAEIPGSRVTFNASHSFFRNVVCSRQPVRYHSAIAAQSSLSSTAGLIYKRKREQEGSGRELCNSSRHRRQVFLFPKCCKPKVSNGTLNKFHLEPELFHDHQQAESFQESCSSDTESTSNSERANYDSDFGSCLSTSTNSGTSDDDEDDSLSESSDVTDESSSQSDSSSVSSRVSLQSIRFRQTSLSALNNKTHLAPQPAVHYNNQYKTDQGGTTLFDYGLSKLYPKKSDCTPGGDKQDGVSSPKQCKHCPLDPGRERERLSGSFFEIPDRPARTDPKTDSAKEISPLPFSKKNKDFPLQRVPGEAKESHQAWISHCAQYKETIVSKYSDSNPSLTASFRKEAKISQGTKPAQPIRNIKEDVEDLCAFSNYNDENNAEAETQPSLLPNVKIKEENSSDEREYSCQDTAVGSQCGLNPTEPGIVHYLVDGGDFTDSKNSYRSNRANNTVYQKSPARRSGIISTLNTTYPDEGDYKNGARVRKNYRTLVLGKQYGNPRTHAKFGAKVNRTPSTGKSEYCEGSEDYITSSKRRRASSNVSVMKKTFNFIANFPPPPSLIIGSDGDLSPAYSLSSTKNNQTPHRSHPVWKWQLGGPALPLPPSHKFRKF